MPVLKPPKPGGGNGSAKPQKDEEATWILILKKGESVEVQYEK